MWLRFLAFPAVLMAGLMVVCAELIGLVVALAWPNLPTLEVITEYQPKIPLRIYTAEGVLIGEFGEERRSVVSVDEVPRTLKDAIVAAEDERFYEHTGIDYIAVLRAALSNTLARGARQGASTITMQVARNFYLSSEKTLVRKLYEALFAFKIESSLTKDQILELYLNQIYLGQRAYGFAAAAQTYFSKPLDKLTLAEAAMLAGLPKAPSSHNPVVNPQGAKRRQQYVLKRLLDLGYINAEQHDAALKANVHAVRETSPFSVHAEFVAEMVRQAILEQYPEDAYARGLRVYTTIRKADQDAAYKAVRAGLYEYDRHDRYNGYRGPEGYVELPSNAAEDQYEEALADLADNDDLLVAVVVEAKPKEVRAALRSGETVSISGEGLKFASSALEAKAAPRKRLRRGSIIRLQRDDKDRWQIVQLPDTDASFISIDPNNGAVRALVGGFDFGRSKFNHVTQAWRQPGSSFKPFIYSASLEKGFTPATVIPDEPIMIDPEITGGQRWEPKNFDGKFEGPMRMRTALAKSKNMVSIRILEAIGPKYAQDYATRFGFDAERHPPYLTMALGAGSVTPWQMARAYAVFANGGYLVEPYFIQRIVDDHGNELAVANPQRAGDESLRIIDARNAFIMDNMMQDVTRIGTAARVGKLHRRDVAGKTGTTNEFLDAWFCGYTPALVGVAWVGFDQPKTLGRNQTGSVVALPVWMAYMEVVLKGVPEIMRSVPEGVVSAMTGPDPANPEDAKMVPELFYREYAPAETPVPTPASPQSSSPGALPSSTPAQNPSTIEELLKPQ